MVGAVAWKPIGTRCGRCTVASSAESRASTRALFVAAAVPAVAHENPVIFTAPAGQLWALSRDQRVRESSGR